MVCVDLFSIDTNINIHFDWNLFLDSPNKQLTQTKLQPNPSILASILHSTSTYIYLFLSYMEGNSLFSTLLNENHCLESWIYSRKASKTLWKSPEFRHSWKLSRLWFKSLFTTWSLSQMVLFKPFSNLQTNRSLPLH